MKTVLIALTLALSSASVQAVPLSFFDTRYSISALAIAGANVDSNSGDSLASSLPLFTNSLSSSGDAQASGAALADDGVLGTLADALGADDPASAVASSEFLGSFLAPGGLIELMLDFDVDGQNEGLGSASSLLRVILLAGSDTLLDTTYSTTGIFRPLVIGMAAGTEGLLSIALTSTADATGLTDLATTAGGLNFAVQAVPEPSSLALALLAGVLLTVRVSRTRGDRIRV